MKHNFDKAFELVVGHEGGFTRDRRDRGNWTTGRIGQGELKGTKFGVSAMSYPDLDIKNLTVAQAKEIYRRDYWDRTLCDLLPSGIDYLVFDAAVNHGRKKSAQILQSAVGANPDGVIGPRTLDQVQRTDTDRAMTEFVVNRQLFYTAISTWKHYKKGWTRRNIESLLHASHIASSDVSDIDNPDTVLGGLFRRV